MRMTVGPPPSSRTEGVARATCGKIIFAEAATTLAGLSCAVLAYAWDNISTQFMPYQVSSVRLVPKHNCAHRAAAHMPQRAARRAAGLYEKCAYVTWITQR
jgi:hypothetical protein